jgi:hypothetical protein
MQKSLLLISLAVAFTVTTASAREIKPNIIFSPYDNPRLPDGPPGEHLPDRLAAERATTKHRW